MEQHNQETWGKEVYLFSLTLICYKVIEMVWFYNSHIMEDQWNHIYSPEIDPNKNL